MSWHKIGFVKASKYRRKILYNLKNKPKTPKEISKETDLYLSHVSKTLKELLTINLVNCLNPNLRKGKLYTLSDEGREILQKI